MEVKHMDLKNNYPKIQKEVNKFLKFRRITLLIFLFSIIVCTIVNLSVGGKLWMLYVIGAEIIFYFAVLNRPLIDNTFVKRFTILVFIICAYLYLIDIIEKTHWSYFVITIIGFAIIIIQSILYFTAFKYQRKKFIPMFWTCIFSVIFCLLAIVKVVKMNWPTIVLGSLGLALIIVMFTIFRKTIVSELKKYFNTN